jgi:HEAT repeat protein
VPPWIGAVAALPLIVAVWMMYAYSGRGQELARSEELWIEALRGQDKELVSAAAHALGQLAPQSGPALQALLEATGSANPKTREAAVLALGEAGMAAQPIKSELLRLQKQDPEPDVRTAAENSIKKIESAAPAGRGRWLPMTLTILLAGLAGACWWVLARRSRPLPEAATS